ncbi:MAG TPA: hypothetical protein VFA18_25700 [Gemmataceae bacterium]|nr:hypothetical protein [Gemmataceae bacterium]
MPSPKKLIEDAYTLGATLGLSVWCCDQAGPFQTLPYPGQEWQPQGQPAQQPHPYLRNGTAKLRTLLHPADGPVRLTGVTACPNKVVHGWLPHELPAILDTLAPAEASADRETLGALWERWQRGLTVKPTLAQQLPPLRMLLVLDNLAGHKTAALVLWLLTPGILPLYTPLGGWWLKRAESIQRILKRRAWEGQHPGDPSPSIAWWEAVAEHWKRRPRPLVWAGKGTRRRDRQRERRHRLGGSAAYSCQALQRSKKDYGDEQGK